MTNLTNFSKRGSSEFFVILVYLDELNKNNLQKNWKRDEGVNIDQLLNNQALLPLH